MSNFISLRLIVFFSIISSTFSAVAIAGLDDDIKMRNTSSSATSTSNYAISYSRSLDTGETDDTEENRQLELDLHQNARREQELAARTARQLAQKKHDDPEDTKYFKSTENEHKTQAAKHSDDVIQVKQQGRSMPEEGPFKDAKGMQLTVQSKSGNTYSGIFQKTHTSSDGEKWIHVRDEDGNINSLKSSRLDQSTLKIKSKATNQKTELAATTENDEEFPPSTEAGFESLRKAEALPTGLAKVQHLGDASKKLIDSAKTIKDPYLAHVIKQAGSTAGSLMSETQGDLAAAAAAKTKDPIKKAALHATAQKSYKTAKEKADALNAADEKLYENLKKTDPDHDVVFNHEATKQSGRAESQRLHKKMIQQRGLATKGKGEH